METQKYTITHLHAPSHAQKKLSNRKLFVHDHVQHQQNVSTRCLIPYTPMLMDGRLYLDKIKPTFDLLIAAKVWIMLLPQIIYAFFQNTLINQVGHRQGLTIKQKTRNTLTPTATKYLTNRIIYSI